MQLSFIYSVVHFLLGSLDGSVLDSWDFILDHGAHGVDLERLLLLLSLLLHGLVVLNWHSWLGVFSCVGNNRRISLNGGLVHWDFLFLLLLLVGLLFFLVLWLLGLIFLLRVLVLLLVRRLLLLGLGLFLLIFLLFFLLNLFGWFFLFSLRLVLGLSIFLHVLGQRFHEVISEASSELHSLWVLNVGGTQQSCNNKGRCVFH